MQQCITKAGTGTKFTLRFNFARLRGVSFNQEEESVQFEWDENKNMKNLDKHGIDFNDAITIFDDDDRLEAIDDRNDYGEERIQVIGEAKPGVLMAVYTWRKNNTSRRMISARTASKKERALYQSMKSR
ncbi:BrnT family toxin [Agaribacterium haliotis]|uniref:BrnT family toxin n=1 Tax=Agaribacterium haliotis TaxID=2013869 RepID=UPI0019581234|nr:BrnT family toxin [Agaribacterium haliotis]